MTRRRGRSANRGRSESYPIVDGERTGLISFRDGFDYVTGDDPVALRDPHWLPQCALLHPELIAYDVVGRFENFANDFSLIFECLGAPPKRSCNG